ncbi:MULTISPECIES: DUF1345 domain-containing protein [unclassified Curtobacterium]|uniref:DUF1345 domain-containing protein n=1 Tax=unclassified Curtobacterium TaxID=257496 RepID=UPI0015E8E65F|nr:MULTISPECIES: DUF1345 domain-containing protein [unclassified Curtobacterium]WIE79189.1 DUF1345 domain-containing protein [Curtobacterium sp. MCSS17_016]
MTQSTRPRSRGFSRARRTLVGVTETAILLSSVAYLFVGEFWTLVVWEAVTLVYLLGGLVATWPGHQVDESKSALREVERWSWLLPLVASVTGAYSAVVALVAQADGGGALLFAITASIGVVLSWTLLQVGFAHTYWAADGGGRRRGVRFPGKRQPVLIDYLYFSFTIGTAFATSDAQVESLGVRRVVMLHSILSFFYNALVVAVAFQVLQQVIRN